MVRNVGDRDRRIRAFAGLLLLAAAAVGDLEAPWRAALVVFGLVPLMSAALRSCPLYTAFGLQTTPRRRCVVLPFVRPIRTTASQAARPA